jgi:spore coat protein CotH
MLIHDLGKEDFFMKNTYKFRIFYKSITMVLMVALLAGCSQIDEISTTETESSSISTWNEETHSNDVEPNYDVVFNQDKVLELNITIDPDEWEAMNADLGDSVTSKNNGGVGGGQGRNKGTGEAPKTTEGTESLVATEGEEPASHSEIAKSEEMPERPEMAEGTESTTSAKPLETIEDSDNEPIWVTSTIAFEGDTWENVGIRFKGNSSLKSVASTDINKFSFKLDFDQFEDEYPEIENQRFYGFKQLNLNNNFGDQSLLHEKVAADLFRDFGLASAETSFCAVYVDYGEGSQYFGLYTIVEEVDDTVLDEQFDDGGGNLYKPEDKASTFEEGSYNESEMKKKTNEDEEDYSDVKALYTIINSDLKTSDVEAWKDSLEEVFNVDVFLKWLAVNTVIQNWDTYGTSTHNYYLYNDPNTGLLNWIPWDNNEALSEGKRGGTLSLGLTEVSDKWPLISYIIDIPEYKEAYESYLAQFVDEVFTEEAMTETFDKLYELIKPYAYAEEKGYSFINSDQDFDNAVANLYEHVINRNNAVDAYLND